MATARTSVAAHALRLFRRAALVPALAAVSGFVGAQQPIVVQALDCRGEEPGWRLDATRAAATHTTLSPKGKREVVFRGSLQALSFLTPPVVVWRGDSTHLPRETLVATVREEACRSTMADGPPSTHRAVLSVRAGEAVTGCCTVRAGFDARVAPVANFARKKPDDWARLLPDDPRLAEVAAASRPALALVAELATEGRLRFRAGGRALVHCHCHEKALGFAQATRDALAAVPGLEVEDPDAGCCGMSGVFGYEAEHYALSVAMGERALLPAVRAARPDTAVLATGTSCRSQLRDLGGRAALHPLEFLAGRLQA
jgi:hypothetical protein